MKLPLIKHIHQFIKDKDEDFVSEAIELLEHLSDNASIKDDELDLIGELVSNMYGALEVHQAVKDGQSERDALNGFMQRVMGSIDKNE